jgi:probable phosphoglycerate mutase
MILLIRHGETAFNAARVIQPEDTPLSERGLAQAERVAARAAELGVERVLSSDLPRARSTAEAIARASGAPIVESALLQERNFGEIRGRAYAEIGRDIFAREYLPPGGESWPQFEARVQEAWRQVVELRGSLRGNLAVVTHGLVCRAIAELFLVLEQGQSVPARWGNTSLTLCDPTAPHTVRLLNSVEHLSPGSDDHSAPSGI